MTNTSSDLVQWRAAVDKEGPFSLPLTSGLLNPRQSVSLAAAFAPKMTGTHATNIVITTHVVQVATAQYTHQQHQLYYSNTMSTVQGGGSEVGVPAVLRLQGSAADLGEAVESLSRVATGVSVEYKSIRLNVVS